MSVSATETLAAHHHSTNGVSASNVEEMILAQERPGLWTLIREDYLVNGCDWTKPGFRAMVMYRFGVWRMGVRWRVLRAPLSLLYRWMHRYVRNHYGIELHYTTRIGRRFRIAHQSAIVLHEHATIGDDCTIRQGVTIGASNRYSVDEEWLVPHFEKMLISAASASVSGMLAVVMNDVPAGCTAFANPARIVLPPRKAMA